MLATLLVFSVASLLFAITPGPDFALILRTALVYGKRASICASLGIGCGLMVHTGLSVAGLTAVIAHSPFLFRCLTWAGAAYLAWIGCNALFFSARRAPSRAVKNKAEDRAAFSVAAVTDRGAFRQGFLCNVLNPKAIIVYLTVLPQFVLSESPLPASVQLVILGIIIIVVTAGWFVLLSLLFSSLRRWFEDEKFRRRLEQLSGIIFLGFGVRLIVSS